MLNKTKIAVLVSGGGTNLQALIDAQKSGVIKSGEISLVVSNNKNPEYMKKVREITHFPILFEACKPRTGVVSKFLKEHNLDPKDCVLVGDRPLTDILCGKNLGCKTILVDSITADTEAKIVRFVRWLERLSIKK